MSGKKGDYDILTRNYVKKKVTIMEVEPIGKKLEI